MAEEPWKKYQQSGESGPWQKYGNADALTAPVQQQEPAKPSLNDRVRGIFEPGLQRGAILPIARNQQGSLEMAAPQFAVDMVKSFMLPGHVAQGGDYTQEDVTRMALDYNPMARSPASPAGPPTKRQFIRNAPDADELRRASGRLYDDVAAKGIVAPGPEVNKAVTGLAKRMRTEGADEVLHPKAAGMLDKWVQKMANQPDMPLEDLEIMRRQAGMVAKSTDPSEARLGMIMKDAVDDLIDALPDTKGLKQARSMYRRKAKVQDLDEAIFRAENAASGFENGLRTEFRRIIRDKRQRRNYTPDEITAMKKVVDGGPVRQALRLLGHLGPRGSGAPLTLGTSIGAGGGAAVGSAMGGPAGAAIGGVALPVIGNMAGRGAARSTSNAAEYARALAASGGQAPELQSLLRVLTQRSAGPMAGTQIPQTPAKMGPNGGIMVNGVEVF